MLRLSKKNWQASSCILEVLQRSDARTGVATAERDILIKSTPDSTAFAIMTLRSSLISVPTQYSTQEGAYLMLSAAAQRWCPAGALWPGFSNKAKPFLTTWWHYSDCELYERELQAFKKWDGSDLVSCLGNRLPYTVYGVFLTPAL